MFRTIAVVGVIAGLILIAFFGAEGLRNDKEHTTEASKHACDLLAGPCEWETGSGAWQVRLEMVGGSSPETDYQLTVDAPASQSRFLAVLRGESMYMGEYPVPLKPGADGQYSARFSAPLCTEDANMIWRIDLQNGQEPIPEPSPLKLIFQAQH